MGETFIGEFFRWCAKFFPRLMLCRSTHGGVKFKGKKNTEIKPGLFMYWPLVTEVKLIPTAHYPIDLPSQTLTTKDDISITLSPVLVVEINDVMAALCTCYDVDDTAMEIGGAAIVELVMSRTFNIVKKELTSKIWNEFAIKARRLLRPYGVQVVHAYTTDFAESTTFRHMGDGTGLVVEPKE